TGDGIAMAMRAGAAVADLEFMQFHPTALHHPSMPRPLLSEALRGEGAILRDDHGVAFMGAEHPLADLAPRDVVAKAISRRCVEYDVDHLWLDATAIDHFPERFPTIWAACQGAGLDPRRDWLPVAPAAHYLSGGVCTDLDGATTLPGLWACGEAACSGVHGANRLASNSLLDGLVFAPRSISAIARGKAQPESTGVLRGILPVVGDAADVTVVSGGDEEGSVDVAAVRDRLERAMTNDAGVLRDADSLGRATAALAEAQRAVADLLASSRADVHELQNLCEIGRALVAAATARHESRGTHTREDFPEPSNDYLGRFVIGADHSPELVPLPVDEREHAT
ncbi:MAG TPA: FAD-binding protein, partial [Acidimicrobiia bacterium]|nr:FAD-binding protein [Acidimicrobiia bacterium]